MTRATVNPARQQLRSALAELLSDYCDAKGLETGGKLRGGREQHSKYARVRPETHSKHEGFPEADLAWLHKGKVLWKFYILPDGHVSRRLNQRLRFTENVIICVDSAGNMGFIEPTGLLGMLAERFASIDSYKIRSLARDMPLARVPLPNLQFDGIVSENRQFVKDHFSLRMQTGLVQRPVPGQFLQLMCDPAPHTESPRYRRYVRGERSWPKLRGAEISGRRPFLRRPFSVASYGPLSQRSVLVETRGFVVELARIINWMDSEIEVIYRRLPGGPGTNALAKYGKGDKINIVGPLGRGFTFSPAPNVALLAGGGIGAPPLKFLAEELLNSGSEVKIFLGAITKSRLPFELRGTRRDKVTTFERMGLDHFVCTDDGSAGRRGLVTDPLAEYLEGNRNTVGSTRIFACGPRPMLAALNGLACHYDLPCEALLEERMACGFGACISCVCAVKEPGQKARFTRICTEGPAFDVRTVMWHA
ncbi:MAG: dihydroorotate dehydrogenase electron transfer subunit [Candidatus Lindowbacteria bacterium]|nr:dihydroorotate dehydrogenase electron transfer subunit [Candidatus Lindowbacteria bacterium]